MQQDILKLIYKNSFDDKTNEQQEIFNINTLTELTGAETGHIKKHLTVLHKKNLITYNGDSVTLTPEGEKAAGKVLRSHRLWEAYLTGKDVLGKNYIHSDAEEAEHLLTDEILDEIEEALGHPEFDPHGSPIPKKPSK